MNTKPFLKKRIYPNPKNLRTSITYLELIDRLESDINWFWENIRTRLNKEGLPQTNITKESLFYAVDFGVKIITIKVTPRSRIIGVNQGLIVISTSLKSLTSGTDQVKGWKLKYRDCEFLRSSQVQKESIETSIKIIKKLVEIFL